MENRKIGMLGAGNMASALVRGLLSSKSVGPAQIRCSDVRADQNRAFVRPRAQAGPRTRIVGRFQPHAQSS